MSDEIKMFIFLNVKTGELFATTNSTENDAYIRAERYFGGVNVMRDTLLYDVRDARQILEWLED